MSTAAGPQAVALVGATGLVGSQIRSALFTLPWYPTVHAIARRAISEETASAVQLIQHIDADLSKWPTTFKDMSPFPSVFLSALGTTRAMAGSLAAQRQVDLDANVALAQAAKNAGVKVYVLISSAAVSKTSPFPYSKLKAEIEEQVAQIGFEHTVIVKPGLLVGDRADTRAAEAVLRYTAKGLGRLSKPWLMDWWAQDVETIGRAAVNAAIQCASGEKEKGVWFVQQADIIRLGRTEWGYSS